MARRMVQEIITSETPIDQGLSPQVRPLAGIPRYVRPPRDAVSTLVKEAVGKKDINTLADVALIFANKWEGAVDFHEWDIRSQKNECIILQARIDRLKAQLAREERQVARGNERLVRVWVRAYQQRGLLAREKAQRVALERRLARMEARKRMQAPRTLDQPRGDGRPRRACTVGQTYRV